jgi:transcriptional regulator with XRE-family HTH domain
MLEESIVASTAERLKLAIDIRHTTAAEVSKKTGISKGSLSQYMTGKFLPKQDRLYILARCLRVSPVWLMGVDVPMEWSGNTTYETSIDDEIIATEKISAKEALESIKRDNRAVFKPLKKLLIAISDQTPNEEETELLCGYRKLSNEQKQTVAALIKTLLQSK